MFEQITLNRVANRANQLIAAGDTAAARAEVAAFVANHPRSVNGWTLLHAAVERDNGTIEERLDVLRGAVKAIPYDYAFVNHLVHQLIDACVAIGDRRYLAEASEAIDGYERSLGASAESWTLRALVSQFRGDDAVAVELCSKAEAALELHPMPFLTFQIGMCLASISGQEARGLALAEGAAQRAKRPDFLLMIAVLLRKRDPARSEELRAEARRLARGVPPEQLDLDFARAADDLQRQLEFLQQVKRG